MSSTTGVMPAPVWVTPLLRRRASEEAHDQLRSKILTGELPAGTRLFEATYARNLGSNSSAFSRSMPLTALS